MDKTGRNIELDIYDYSGHKKCNLYDSGNQILGQAHDVCVTTERNGWKELSFTLPSECLVDEQMQENPRLKWLKADYRIRLKDVQVNTVGREEVYIDWFLVSEPKVTHKAWSKNVDVTAAHISQLLKTKNLGLEFNDELGNNVGTAKQLLETILEGTGWKPGKVSQFYEEDGKTIKRRSMNAGDKQGAFKLVSALCTLFEAKAIYNGEGRTVDILPMNPFSESKDGGLPDITAADRVVELHYGTNLSNITRTLNTENLVTKLYAYGAYGDTTHGYCGVDVAYHKELWITTSEELKANQPYHFEVKDVGGMDIYRSFVPLADIPAGSTLIYSLQGPSTMMYVWDEANQRAYFVQDNAAGTKVPIALSTYDETQNWFSYLMDFTYYKEAGLFEQEHLDKLALFERTAMRDYQKVYNATQQYSDALTTVAETVGSVAFAKLDVAVPYYPPTDKAEERYLRLPLVTGEEKNGILYRSDWQNRERDQFLFAYSDELKPNGDPVNDVASVVYILHDTNPISWDKVFVKALYDTNGNKIERMEHGDVVGTIELWTQTVSTATHNTDRYYLLPYDNINGKLGALEIADESTVAALENATRLISIDHPTTFTDKAPTLPENPTVYQWAWHYKPLGQTSDFYFYNPEKEDGVFCPVIYTDVDPDSTMLQNKITYLYNWRKATLWRAEANRLFEQLTSLPDKKIARIFGTVYSRCRARDQYYYGLSEKYTYVHHSDKPLPAGNYYLPNEYGTYWVFQLDADLPPEIGKVYYDTVEGWAIVERDGVPEPITSKAYRYDNCRVYTGEGAKPGDIEIDDDVYHRLEAVPSEERKSIPLYLKLFADKADEAYAVLAPAVQAAQAKTKEAEANMIEALGDMYREGYWQDSNYVEGDEAKLYTDAMDTLKKIAKPEATYNIGFLDRYGAQSPEALAPLVGAQGFGDITMNSAIHLVDPEIDVNTWAYVNKLKICYDKPWATTLEIDTNLTTMAQHTFADVMTNIANVAKEMKGKTTLYNRAQAITGQGTLLADRLEGQIDANRLKLTGGSSTWYTDERGNMVFVSGDGQSAMTLTGNGFAIADSKNKYGEWAWRTFGTGSGFTADEITAGFLSADRIEAGSISAAKLGSDVTAQITLDAENIVASVKKDIADLKGAPTIYYRSLADAPTENLKVGDLLIDEFNVVYEWTKLDGSKYIWKVKTQDVNSFRVNVDANSVFRNESHIYTPESITVTGHRITGTGEMEKYRALYECTVYGETDDPEVNTARWNSGITNMEEWNFSIPDSLVAVGISNPTKFVITMYRDNVDNASIVGGFTVLDKVEIPIVNEDSENVFYQPNEPDPNSTVLGAFWINTDNGGLMYQLQRDNEEEEPRWVEMPNQALNRVNDLSTQLQMQNNNLQAISTELTTSLNEVKVDITSINDANDLLKTYLTITEDGLRIGKIINGSTVPFSTLLTNSSLEFQQQNTPVAYINDHKMYIANARITDVFQIGTPTFGWYEWVAYEDGPIALRWAGGGTVTKEEDE